MENKELKVVSVNISKEKGTKKKPNKSIILDEYGVKGDAHRIASHRQVSLLAKESADEFLKNNKDFTPGMFAENITTEGFKLNKTSPLDKLITTQVELEITQIGEECHDSKYDTGKKVRDCIMLKEGIFARVLKPGEVKEGDTFTYHPRDFNFKIITLSNRISRGDYEDISGPRIIELIQNHFKDKQRKINISYNIIPDDQDTFSIFLEKISATKTDVLLTTGGTGIGRQDITVETVKPLLDKEIPGIMENIRIKYGSKDSNALLSRGVSGLIDKTLVYTLPGSVKAVEKYMSEIFKTLEPLIYMKEGLDIY